MTGGNDIPILQGQDMTLEDWLKAIDSPEHERSYHIHPFNCFPLEEHRSQYLTSIMDRTDKEILSLLRRFLLHSGNYGVDLRILEGLKLSGNLKTALDEHEFVRRIISRYPSWEGITWVLDLLDQPRRAIEVLQSYARAHAMWLTDEMIHGIYDAMAVIRARYIDMPHPRSALLGIEWRDFELLVASLFQRIGFEVTVTPCAKDGGYDVMLLRSETSRSEQSLVECKRHKKNISVKEVRALLGVVERKHATRGILVATSGFSAAAREEAGTTGRLELIDQESLHKLLNQYFGPDWPSMIDRHITHARHAFEKSAGG